MTQQAVQNLTNKAIRCIEGGKYGIAIALLTDVLSEAPTNLTARKYLRAAQIMAFKAENSGRMTLWIREAKAFPSKLRAERILKQQPGNLAALKLVERLLEVNPFNPAYIDLAVKAAQSFRMPELAALTIETVCENTPASDVRLLEKAAMYYTLAKRYDKARDVYKKILDHSPSDQRVIQLLKNAEAQCTIADGWEQNAGKEGATRDLLKNKEEAERLDRNNKAEMFGNDVDKAAAEYVKRLEAAPQDTVAARALARLYMKSKRYQDAIKVLDGVTKLVTDPELDKMMSAAKLAVFDMIIQERKDRNESYTEILAERDLFEIDDMFARVERYPNDSHLRFELGNLMIKQKRYDEAIRHLQISQKNPKDRLDSLYLLAKCFRAKGQRDLAVMQLETARDAIPTMTELKKKVVYELAQCAEDAADDEAAYQYYKDIYSNDVTFMDVEARMMTVKKVIDQKKAQK